MFLLLLAAPAWAANQKPLADAGPDQQVGLSVPVSLDGTRSRDGDGRIRRYRWRQTQGPKVKLAQSNTATPRFISPAKPATLAFRLAATDNKGATARDSVQVSVAPQPVCIPPQVLQGAVCATPEPFCPPPRELRSGVCVSPQPECAAGQLLQNGACVTPAPECRYPKVLENGVCATPPSGSLLNDTGITRCGDALYLVDCPLAIFPGQDAETGRDATRNDSSDGHAGFSFVKIGADGRELPADAPSWPCVRDTLTGLVWEVKTNDGGLHDKAHVYTNSGMSSPEVTQYGPGGDAEGFVRTVNAQGLCGANDWRLPTAGELQGLVHYGKALPGPAIDTAFFPHTPGLPFWTSSPIARDAAKAQLVYFDDGGVFGDSGRDEPFPVRLVRAGNEPVQLSQPGVEGISGRLMVSADGQEITDGKTGLVWRRCVEGMQWDGRTCTGVPDFFMWEHALHRAESVAHDTGVHWRLPNVKELASLVDTSAPGLAIDLAAFPGTPNDQFWTSSPYNTDAFYAWAVHTFFGAVYFTYLEDTAAARLVRDSR